MKKYTAYLILIYVLLTLCSGRSIAQLKDSVIDNIVKEENENSQLTQLAHELFDNGSNANPEEVLPHPRRTILVGH